MIVLKPFTDLGTAPLPLKGFLWSCQDDTRPCRAIVRILDLARHPTDRYWHWVCPICRDHPSMAWGDESLESLMNYKFRAIQMERHDCWFDGWLHLCAWSGYCRGCRCLFWCD